MAIQREPHSPTPSDQPFDRRTDAVYQSGLKSLDIRDFRNFRQASLNLAPGLNLVTGSNASGKTSLLEAIYTLGRVRSFRTHVADQPIRYGQAAYRLVGRVTTGPDHTAPVGIERSPSGYTVHMDGEPVRRLSDLAGCFPVQVFSGDTATVLSGGPRQRRHTLDWALFHVEQRYRDTWQRYTRVMRQRNAALRARASGAEIHAWDGDLLEAAGEIDRFRRDYLDCLSPHLREELHGLLPGTVVSVRYRQGWPIATSLAEALAASLEKDRARGYTQYGPHRADFRLLLDEHAVEEHCSRGQQKTVLLGLMLAQLRYQHSRGGSAGAFLLDDLTSELDEAHQSRVLQALRKLQAQVFVTAIQADSIDFSRWQPQRLFHVEHGTVREVV